MKRFRVVDVRADGSCFYRSLYLASKSVNADGRLLKKLSGVASSKFVTPSSENDFVQRVRDALSARILSKNDGGIVKDVYQNLKIIQPRDYKAIMTTSFPTWFVSTFKKLPSSEQEFRKEFAQGMVNMSSWASEIEVRIVNDFLKREMKMPLVIFNSPPRPEYAFKKNTMYLLNKNELHYNAIIVTMEQKPHVKVTIIHGCKESQVLNPATGRCVSKTSCKGYEVRLRTLESRRRKA
jgi:hypothetical protein